MGLARLRVTPSEHVRPTGDGIARTWGGLVGLFVVALAIRLPGLLDIPRFEDEGVEALWGLDIARGDRLPLTGSDEYYGPLFSYMVAALFRIFGPDALWPRLMVAVFGALTVLATYWLGRVAAGARAGTIAAFLAMTSPMLVIANSHLGWSNSLSPFFAVATLIAIFAGIAHRRAGAAAVGGFLAGLTLQTHPLNVVLLGGIALWYLLSVPARDWMRRREMYIALAAFAVAYAPMIWQVVTGWNAVTSRIEQSAYAYSPVQSIGDYLRRIPIGVFVLLSAVAGVTETFFDPAAGRGWRVFDATLVAGMSGLLIGALVAARRATVTWRPGAPTFLRAAFLVPPLLLCLVTSFFVVRYLMFLLPIAYVCMAPALATRWERSRLHGIALLAVIVGLNVVAIVRMHESYARRGLTNAPFFQLQDIVRKTGACRDGILMEEKWTGGIPQRGSSWVLFNHDSVRFVLEMSSCGLTLRSADGIRTLAAARSSWIIVSERSLPVLSRDLHLERIVDIAPEPAVPTGHQLALFRARPGLP